MTAVTFKPSRRERKKAETHRRIVEAASRVFEARGFENVTVEEIAAAADIGKGTIYNYFSTKEAILAEFLIEIEERVQRRLGRLAEAPGPLEAVLEAWIRYQFRLKRPYLPLVRVFLAQLLLHPEEMQGHAARIQVYIDQPLTSLLERLQQRALIPEGADLSRIGHELKCLHFGLSCLWAMEGPPFRMTLRSIKAQTSAFAHAVERGSL